MTLPVACCLSMFFQRAWSKEFHVWNWNAWFHTFCLLCSSGWSISSFCISWVQEALRQDPERIMSILAMMQDWWPAIFSIPSEDLWIVSLQHHFEDRYVSQEVKDQWPFESIKIPTSQFLSRRISAPPNGRRAPWESGMVSRDHGFVWK